MRRIGTVVIRIFVISLALVLLVFAQKQPATSRTQPTSPSSGATEQTPKIKGRNLVKKLPVGIEGVTLEDGFIKLKPGYKFVKEQTERSQSIWREEAAAWVAHQYAAPSTVNATKRARVLWPQRTAISFVLRARRMAAVERANC